MVFNTLLYNVHLRFVLEGRDLSELDVEDALAGGQPDSGLRPGQGQQSQQGSRLIHRQQSEKDAHTKH